MFIYESLYVSVVKLFPHIGLQVFRVSIALSNYLSDSVSRLVSIFTFDGTAHAYLFSTSMTVRM